MYNDNLSFFLFLLCLWLLSPIGLIIACVHLSRSRAKLREELEALRKKPAGAEASEQKVMPSTEPVAIAGEKTETPPLPKEKTDNGARGRDTGAGKRSVNSLNVVFIIGVLFIIVAGVIFASSTWRVLGTAARIAILASVSVFFFVSSRVARSRFTLHATGAAFFVLGSIFLPVSFVAAGLLSLFGEAFTLSGTHVNLLFAGGVALLALVSVRGALLYRSRTFAWSALSSLSAFVVFCTLNQSHSLATVSLVLALYCALLILVIEAFSRFGDRIDTALPGIRNSPFAKPFRLFAVLNVLASSAVSVSGGGGEYLYIATWGVFALLFLTKAFNDPRYKYPGMGVFPFALCLTLSLIRLPGTDVVPAIVVSSALVMIFGIMGIVPEGMKKMTTGAALVAVAASAVFGISSAPVWNAQLLASVAILAIATGFRVRSGERVYRYLHPLLLALFAFGSVSVIGDSRDSAYAIAGIGLLAAMSAYIPLKWRSRVSDIIFLLSFIADFFILQGRSCVSGSLVLLAILALALAYVARTERYARFALPHCAALGFLATGSLFAENQFAAILWYALLSVAGVAEIFARKKIRTGEARDALKIAIACWGAVCVAAGFAGESFELYPIILCLATVYWALSSFLPPERRKSDLWITGILFLSCPLAAAHSWCASYSIPLEWSLFGAVFASLVLLFPLYLPFVRKSDSGKKTLFALSAGALNVCACLIAVTYISAYSLPLSYGVAALVLIAGVFALDYFESFTALALVPLALVYSFPKRAIPDFLSAVGASGAFGSMGDFDTLSNLCYCAIAGISIAGSMVLFRALSTKREDGHVNLDCFALIGPIAPVLLIATGYADASLNADFWLFVGYILLSLTALLFWQRTKRPLVDRLATSAAVAALAAACIAEPFFTIPAVIADEYRLLIPLAALLAAHRFIWKDDRLVTGWLSFAWGCACIVILSFQAIDGGMTADALILGVGSLLVFIASFSFRLKRIFLLSTVTLTALGLYLSRQFWLSLAWWVYLLSAGIILITIAVINESYRKKGSGILITTGKIFGAWRW